MATSFLIVLLLGRIVSAQSLFGSNCTTNSECKSICCSTLYENCTYSECQGEIEEFTHTAIGIVVTMTIIAAALIIMAILKERGSDAKIYEILQVNYKLKEAFA